MKKLILVRHAKAEKDSASLKDFDRDLNRKGVIQANVSAYFMKFHQYKPDLVLCSGAKRTRKTFQILQPPLFISKDQVVFNDHLYLVEKDKILKEIKNTHETIDCLMLVGHNFGISDVLSDLIGEQRTMSTADVAVLELNVQSWSDIVSGIASLKDYFTPKVTQ